MPQVVAAGVFRDRQGKKSAGLEFAAKPLGQPGHLHRIANWLVPLVELLVTSLKSLDLIFLPAQLGGLSSMTDLVRHLGQPFQACQIGRVGHEQAF